MRYGLFPPKTIKKAIKVHLGGTQLYIIWLIYCCLYIIIYIYKHHSCVVCLYWSGEAWAGLQAGIARSIAVHGIDLAKRSEGSRTFDNPKHVLEGKTILLEMWIYRVSFLYILHNDRSLPASGEKLWCWSRRSSGPPWQSMVLLNVAPLHLYKIVYLEVCQHLIHSNWNGHPQI